MRGEDTCLTMRCILRCIVFPRRNIKEYPYFSCINVGMFLTHAHFYAVKLFRDIEKGGSAMVIDLMSQRVPPLVTSLGPSWSLHYLGRSPTMTSLFFN